MGRLVGTSYMIPYNLCEVLSRYIVTLCLGMEIVRRRFVEVGVALFRNPCTVRSTAKLFYRSMSMKALVIEEFGDSSKLKCTEVSKPEPCEGEVKYDTL